MISKLQYISQGKTSEEQLKNIQDALEGGCNWIQLRFKNCEEKQLMALAFEVKKLCSAYKATFIINDHVQIAKLVDTDGVHLGLTDMKISDARKILGNKIIGGTANKMEDVRCLMDDGVGYIGLGPYRFTTTKEKLNPILGLEGIRSIAEKFKNQIPIIAIGGIKLEDVELLMQTGIYGVAVSSAINFAEDKSERIKKIYHELHEFSRIKLV